MLLDGFHISRPLLQDTAVIFSSPHSGKDYPPAFLAHTVLDLRAIRSSEDAFIDDLFAAAPTLGAPLLFAQVPRAFIDLNRAPDELDPALIEGIDRLPHNPRVSSGLGVIPRVVSGGKAIYHGKLPLAVARARIARYWHPYHRALLDLLESTHKRFGQAILIDCHSMPHEALNGYFRPGQPRPDVILGDRFGASASPEIVTRIASAFCAAGLRVVRNTPFAGAFIAQNYGHPSVQQHVVQVEIDRALYMDEATLEPHQDYENLRLALKDIVAEIADIGRENSWRLAAE